MSKHDTDFWDKAVDARNELADRYAGNADVKYVDIGYPPTDGDTASDVALRVHVDDRFTVNSDDQSCSQQSVNGFPVCVVRGR